MAYKYRFPHPAVATDAVVFTVRDARLEVLLIQRRNPPFKGMWAFPGGFLEMDEDLRACCERELAEETGVRGVVLEQFHAAGKPGRDPRERNISILHMGLVRAGKVQPVAGDDAGAVGWFPAHRPPRLAFDHRELMRLARRHLAFRLETSSAALALLPPQFTLDELRQVYEAVGQAPIEARRFNRQARKLSWLSPVTATGDKTARLYQRAKRRNEHPTRPAIR
jgi:8-oxo-dGTP diphosphatase